MVGGFQVGPFQPLPAFQQATRGPQRSNVDTLRIYHLLHYIESDGTGITLPDVDYSVRRDGGVRYPYAEYDERKPYKERQFDREKLYRKLAKKMRANPIEPEVYKRARAQDLPVPEDMRAAIAAIVRGLPDELFAARVATVVRMLPETAIAQMVADPVLMPIARVEIDLRNEEDLIALLW